MEETLRGWLPCLRALWDRIWPEAPTSDAVQRPRQVATISGPYPQAKVPVRPTPAAPIEAGPICTALYDFEARTSEELSLKKGEKLRVIRNEGDYLYAQKNTGSKAAATQGLVPANYVKITKENLAKQPWYFGRIGRVDAEKLLTSAQNQNGAFLVRRSEIDNGGFSISALNDKVHHYRILTSSEGYFYLHENQKFPTVIDLMEFYKLQWKIFGFPLTKPCIKQEAYNADEWERPREEFSLLKKLGEGHFGEVWEGIWNENQHVAIKMLKKDDMNVDMFLQEIKIMKSISHPNLIRLYAVCSIEEPVYIITELMSKGSLKEYLSGDEGKTLTITHHVYFASQVAEGMAYLERHKFVHRDLAARNVLVGEDLVCKVADFGLMRLIRDEVYNVQAGTKLPVKWTAPETANYQRYSVKSDVWSFGVLLYEIVTYGNDPYERMTNQETVDKVNQGYRMPRPKTCTPDIYDIMLRCWNESEENRPSFSTLTEELNSLYSQYFYNNQDQGQKKD
ncbi:tyrosine-protein kinase Srms [Mobula hypostoma]|uniref:tyrosine-protein kinase Srms n=1 Tax=Mobula hypostoma TaxID=723540 RepID=UPI002FC2F5D9